MLATGRIRGAGSPEARKPAPGRRQSPNLPVPSAKTFQKWIGPRELDGDDRARSGRGQTAMTRITYCLGLAALGIALTPAAPRSATADEPDSVGVIARLKAGVAGRFRALVPGRPARKDAGILPGVTYRDDAPAWFRKPGAGLSGGERVIKGRLSATEERALADNRQAIEREVAEWLGPDVPRSWKPPKAMVDGLIRTAHVEPIPRDLGIPVLSEFRLVYQAGSVVDLGPARRERIIAAFNRDLVTRRLGLLGGGLGLALIGLAGLAGFIRADEATKGYYTTRLRLLAAAGVGAASVALVRMFA